MPKETISLIDNPQESGLFYQNPFPISDIGDPYVMRAENGKYYLFCTSAADGYYCWRSDDLVHWEDKKIKCYTYGKDAWADHSFWAPEVVEYNHKYYMFYTAGGKDISLRIGLAVADQPEGPYEDVYDHPLFDFGHAAIDAHVFIDGDGQKYLYYSKDCSENEIFGTRKSEIYGIKLSEDMMQTVGEPVRLLTPEQPWELASSNPLWNEGPELIKHDGRYYLTYSANCYASKAYSVGYATADSPLGPYEKAAENPILTAGFYEGISGPGHHSMIYTPEEEALYFVYHTHTYPKEGGGNRQVNLDRACFDEEGRLCVSGPTVSLQPLPSADLRVEWSISDQQGAQPHLRDGLFSIHKGDSDRDVRLKTNAKGEAELKIHLEEAAEVQGLMIYRGSDPAHDFTEASLLFDGRAVASGLMCPKEREDRAAIALFKPRSCTDITITLFAEPETEIAVSEIRLL